MDVLSSRILLRPADLGQSRRFYRDVLGLAIYREFGDPADPDVVFFLGPGLLEVSGRSAGPPGGAVMIWLQVRDVHAEHRRLVAAGVRVVREPVTEPWGLIEMWIEDPDGVAIVLVEIPVDHPLRRDQRSFSPTTLSTGAVNHTRHERKFQALSILHGYPGPIIVPRVRRNGSGRATLGVRGYAVKVIVNTPGDDLAAWIGVAGVAVGVLLTTVVEWLRDRRGLARERRRELIAAADELANSAISIGFLMSLFAAQQKEAKALDWANAYLPNQERCDAAGAALKRLAPRPVTEAADKVRRASVVVSASRLLADNGESYASEIIETTRTETNDVYKVLARYVR